MTKQEPQETIAGAIVSILFVILIIAVIGWLIYAWGASSVPDRTEVIVELKEQVAPVYLDSDEIKFRSQFCAEHGWDWEPVYDNSYSYYGEIDTFRILGVTCKAFSSRY